jgi:hypothetical protein
MFNYLKLQLIPMIWLAGALASSGELPLRREPSGRTPDACAFRLAQMGELGTQGEPLYPAYGSSIEGSAGQVLVVRGGVIINQAAALREAVALFQSSNADAFLSLSTVMSSDDEVAELNEQLKVGSEDFYCPSGTEQWLQEVARHPEQHHLLILDIRPSMDDAHLRTAGLLRKRALQKWIAGVTEARSQSRVSVLAVASESQMTLTNELSHRLRIPLFRARSQP